MQVSRKKINPKVKKQVYDMLHKVVADLKNPMEVKDFLDSFLGENEQEVISRRLGVAYLLNKGKTYSYIKKNLNISSTTVATVARDIKKSKGFKIALQKIQADEWADRWAQKITQVFGKGQK
jgi:uncharacterized protein YerC